MGFNVWTFNLYVLSAEKSQLWVGWQKTNSVIIGQQRMFFFLSVGKSAFWKLVYVVINI